MSSPAALTTVAAGGSSEDRHQNHNNTANSEGGTTMAMQKKRARRVSFAEMTSVHFFDRDEEYETPPDPSGKAESNSGREEMINLGFDHLVDDSKESEDGDEGNDEDEDEDDEIALPRSFLRPAESPSPGSNFGSATSNDDEDNFFGPVSPNFIRPGRLSDSAVSDKNHDITMDSTAFSMHFRRFVRSDSGIDLKTPTEVSFDEKTPTQTGLGNSMELTMAKKLISQSCMPVANFSGTSDSSDMSLIGENSRRYDYGSLPPDLEALLAEGREKHAVSVSGDTSDLESPASKKMEVGNAMMDLGGNGEQEANAIVSLNMALVPLCQKIDDADDGNKLLSRAIDADMLPISAVPAPDNYVDRVNQSPKQLSKFQLQDVGENNKSVKDASGVGIREALCSNDGELGQFFGSPRDRESPLVDLVSSSPATQGLIVIGSPSSVKQNSMAVSFLEDPISFLSNGKRGPWTSSASLQKNISKLESLKASELSSSLGDRIPNMDIRSLEFPRTLPLDSILKKRNLQMGVKSLDSSMTCTEEQFSGTSMKEGERRMVTSGGIRSETLLTGEDVIPCEQSLGPEKQGKSLNRLNTGFLPVDQVLDPTSPLASSRFSWSGKTNDTFTPNDLSQKRSLISRTDSPLVDYLGQEKVTAIAQKLVFSPEKSLQSKSSTWTEHQSSPFKESKLHDEPMKSLVLMKNASSIGNVTDGHSSNAADGNWHSSSTSTEEQSGSPVVEGSKVLRQPDGTYSIEAKLIDQMNLLKSTEDSKISRDGNSHLSSAILDGNFQSANGLPRFEIDPRELIKSPLAGAASSSIQNVEALVVEKTPVQWSSRSPPEKGFHLLAQSNTTCSSVGEAAQSPTCNQSIGKPRNSSAHKRCSEELTYGDMEHTNEIIMSQSSSKLQRGVGNCPGISGRPDDSRKEMLRAHLEFRQWKDIKSKCMEDADEWISLPKERLTMLTMPAIEMVEDIVTRMQKAKTYEILHRQILTQKMLVASFQEKRNLEAIMLLCQLVHEKAKYHLRCVKRKKLLEKCQLLNSGIQKSQMSKINHSLHITVSGVTQGDAISSESSLACEKALLEERHNKVATIKEDLEVSERKVAKLARSLRSSFKLEGEPSCAATIISVKEHLMRRSCCRFLRQDMQMCVIQNVRRSFVILNYLGLLVQSLKLTIGPNSSIIISNNLNDQLITKSFPNINVCAALKFVLKAEISKKLGARTLAQEMQVTRSLLGNSLDVIAEVQKAQMQFHNLADIAFSTPTVEELELQLHFVNFNTGKKVKLTLDMSCLNRGVYPSEVVPSQVAALALCVEHSDDALLGEIRAAVKNLRAGYMRIIRLCDCISRVVQASGG